MGVYIPNMSKPKDCRTCNFKSNKEGECWFVHDENDCPLIEVDDELMPPCSLRGCSWYSSTD